jgi:hypothetical protein
MPTADTTFTFHTDPGHGWVEVPIALVFELEIYDDISRYSYHDGVNAFLEEDCDAAIFIRAFEDKHGQRPAFEESHKNQTHVRNLFPWK